MKNTHNTPHHTSNFWFGFAIGSVSLSAIAYLLGTKKGRETLKKVVEYADTVQDMPEELFALLPTIKEMLKKNDTSGNDPPTAAATVTNSLASILEKVKNTAEEKTQQKKFHTKSTDID